MPVCACEKQKNKKNSMSVRVDAVTSFAAYFCDRCVCDPQSLPWDQICQPSYTYPSH